MQRTRDTVALARSFRRCSRAMTSPELPNPAALLQLIVGRWVSAAIGVAARLGIADEVAAGPRLPEAIAVTVGADSADPPAAPPARRKRRCLRRGRGRLRPATPHSRSNSGPGRPVSGRSP